MEEYKHDYAMEKRLKELDPRLHKIFTDSVFALQFNLSNYKLIFPQFTDHTMLHSMTVIDFCNKLIGDQLDNPVRNQNRFNSCDVADNSHVSGIPITCPCHCRGFLPRCQL